MKNKFKKTILNPLKALRYLYVALKKRIAPKKGVLVFIGMDPNGEFDILHPGYKICYGFEANPERYEKLLKKFSQHNNVKLFNYAIADYDGEIEFNISSNNDGASSSVGNFNESWLKSQKLGDIKIIKKIKVQCINLLNFCKENDINYIDDYISDIQGMDLQVLKILCPIIEKRQIGTIKCEVTKDEYRNIYYDLPDNSESGFLELLNDNYELVAKGRGILKDYQFDKVPEEVWEMDCKWKLKEERINIFGTSFSCLDLNEGYNKIVKHEFSKPSYICFPSTSLISDAYKNNKLREIYNNSFITFVDGKFTEFYARLKGYKNIKNVSGYFLMERLLQTELTHYFYGCDDKTLNKLKEKLYIRFPNAKIVGFKSPPYVQLNEIYPNKQIIADFKEINRLNPDLIWIGISTPKQDYLMHYYKKYLDRGVMLGVGAVFLYHAGVINKGPEIFKRLALRWIWRLLQEPGRLWKRSIPGIIHFLTLILKHDILRLKSRKK